jgi:hypothetical protein
MRLEIIQNNYVFIPGFISQSESTGLAEQFKEYCRKFNLVGDLQAPNSQAIYNFLPFVRLLVKKVPNVSELLGEEVLPTYTYARVYKNGSILERHRDRPACEISITLNLSKNVEWPIYFQRPDGSEASAELNPGDAVLYLGCQADHWRNKFEGNEHIQLFLHYVRADGPKGWAFFDKQQQQEPTPPSTDLPVTIL